MIKKLKVFALIVSALLINIASAQDNLLKFGVNPAYPPFEYKNEANEIAGFDIDIAYEICTVLEKKCEFVEQVFDALIPNLKLKRFDVIISAMDITDERLKQINFSDPYYLNPSVFVAIKDKFSSLDELVKGKKIGVLNGSTHQLYIKEIYKDLEVASYPQYPAAINDLLIDRVNIVFGDSAVVAEYLKKNDQLAIVGSEVTDAKYFGKGLGIGARHEDGARIDEINRALKVIKEDGRYQTIFDKWFK